MTNDGLLGEVSETVGRRVREARKRLRWSVEELAEACARVGGGQLTVDALYALESGRRDPKTRRRRRSVTVDELFVLAAALGPPPVDLLVPPDLAEDAPYEVAPSVTTTAGRARQWIGGHVFLIDPETVVELAEAMRGQSPARVRELRRTWLTPEREARFAYRADDLPRAREVFGGDADHQEEEGTDG